MSKRAYLLAATALIVANAASAGYVDLATPGTPADLTLSITDSAVPLGWSVSSQSFTLADASYMSASLQRTNWQMQVSIGLHDKESAIDLADSSGGPTFSYQQLSVALLNFTGVEQAFAANTLNITIGGVHSAEAAQITGFIFTGPDAATNASAWDIFYDPSGAGTLTFSNTAPLTVTSDNLWLHGQFTTIAIPEPSSFAALLGLAAAGSAMARRRRCP